MSKKARSFSIAAAVVVLLASQTAPSEAIGGFGDTPVGEYYSAPIQWMTDSGITQGTEPGCFEPSGTASRGQVAVFIHRLNGAPTGFSESFDDVDSGDYFRDAVAWMVSQGITEGTTPSTFEPDRRVTRGEIATFIHRSAGSPAAVWDPFDDVPAGAFYAEAIGWMVSQGITTGTSATTFEPDRPVTRAEVATFLYRSVGEPAVSYTSGGICSSAGHSVQLDVAEAWSHHLLNILRVSKGLAPLDRSSTMSSQARDWSETMDRTGVFEHSDLPYGENIAWWSWQYASPEAAADKMHALWVDSPGHYANMIHPGYNTMGSGFWLSADGWHATHVFDF